MIKDDIIYFGYGDIVIEPRGNKTIKISNIERTQKVGDNVETQSIEVGRSVVLRVNKYVLGNLNKITGASKFKLGDFILDFTNYNPVSVDTLKECIKAALTRKFCPKCHADMVKIETEVIKIKNVYYIQDKNGNFLEDKKTTFVDKDKVETLYCINCEGKDNKNEKI